MANAMYGKGREHYGNAEIDWIDDDIKVVCVDAADYTVSIDVDEALDDIPAGARVATSANLATKTNVLGAMGAAATVLSSVTGDEFEEVVAYKDSGVESTSWLFLNIDTDSGGAIAVLPNGGDITITWPSPIFTL